MSKRPLKNKAGTQKLVEHHVIYKSLEHPRAQAEVSLFIGQGDHLVITDVQHRVANNNEAMGWCLVFEGCKRLMTAFSERQRKELGL